MKKLTCLRCGAAMNHIMTEKLQLGQTGWILGDLPNLLSGALEVDIHACPGCGKLEFFSTAAVEEGSGGNRIPQIRCPNCGKQHDMDYPKCPFCKHIY